MANSAIFDPGVDAGLMRAIAQTAGTYKKHKVKFRSGKSERPKNPGSMHPKGRAIDIWLEDLETGQNLPGIGNHPEAAQAYQAYANEVYKWAVQNDPELAKELYWGGYIRGDPSRPSGGWAQDFMHFQRGGSVPQGGDWQGGFSPEVMQKLGLKNSGGLGEITAQMTAAGYTPEQIKKAFLDTIASTEANSYDVMYGGEKFSDFSKHPERDMPIFKGSQIVGHSSAAGRYQFLKDTWREQAAKYGYKDFNPETQDTAAWNYASDIFKQKGGGDLMEALSSNDPARQNAAAQILNQTWTSLPGGPEQAKGYGNQTFADVFRKSLGATADSPSEGGSRFGGTGLGTPATGGATTPTAKEPKWSPSKMGEAMASGEGMGQMQGTTVPDLPRAAIHQAEPSGLDPNNLERRKQLAMEMMRRLNTGKLTV